MPSPSENYLSVKTISKSKQSGRAKNPKPAIAIQQLSLSSPSMKRNYTKETAKSPDIDSSSDSEVETPELDKNIVTQFIALE